VTPRRTNSEDASLGLYHKTASNKENSLCSAKCQAVKQRPKASKLKEPEEHEK
jgi:hypothetical protein